MKAFLPLDALDRNKDGRISVDELIQSAHWIFLALLALLGVLIAGPWLMIAGKLPPWRIWVMILILAAAGTATLIVRRMLFPERNEKEAAIDREFERERAQWEFDQARGVSEDARATTLAQAEIDAAALTILQRYYQGKEWTRDACTATGMTAELWNEANGLLKKRGIRRGRKSHLEPESFQEAWGLYCEAKLKANQHRIANGEWTEAI